jgi:hypothetical protein
MNRGDMGASGAAPPLREPELRLIWRGKHELRMSNAIRLAYPRKGDRILGALQRFIIVAKYTYLTGDRRNRFRLVLEAGAVDQATGSWAPISVSTAPMTLPRVSPSANPPSSSTEAKLISLMSSSPKTSMESGANPAWAAEAASERAE